MTGGSVFFYFCMRRKGRPVHLIYVSSKNCQRAKDRKGRQKGHYDKRTVRKINYSVRGQHVSCGKNPAEK